jgi:hypothetical protein
VYGRNFMPLVPKNRGFMSPQAMEQAVALEKFEILLKIRGSLPAGHRFQRDRTYLRRDA